jgi:O-antigen/teichoic acid export membrane protein
MLQQIKRLGSDTAIYGISTIIGRFLNFLLVPFYTNILLPGDLGIVSYIYSMIAFVYVLYSYGMESAYFKYSSTLELGTAKENFTTPFLSLLATSAVFSSVILLGQSSVAAAMKIPEAYQTIIVYAAAIMAFDAITIIPFAALRMERKAKVFAAIKFVNILINVVLNIVLLVVLKMGVIGIFISGFAASAVTLLMLFPTISRNLTNNFNTPLWSGLLKFGLPFIPAGLATQAVQVIDRPILRALTDDATVGIYQANYRLGIFMMLIVQMYDFAWRPFYFSTVKEPNAKQIFSRVLTYLLLFMCGVFLVLTFFIEEIVKISIGGHHLIHPNYWSGLNIIPVVLLGYLFLGISTNLSAGIYIQKKTKFMPAISFAGAFVNVAVNYLLIPKIGILGAAWATFFAYFVMAVIVYFVVQRVYPIHYEWNRLVKITIATCMVYGVYFIVPADGWSAPIQVLFKAGLLALFIGVMYGMKFFDGGELSAIKKMFMKTKDVKAVAINENSPDL